MRLVNPQNQKVTMNRYVMPAAMKLLYNPAIILELHRQQAAKAWKTLTGQTKKPGLRDLQNTWLAEVEYTKVNAREQLSKLRAYTMMGDDEKDLLLRLYGRRQRLGEAIKLYLDELTYLEAPLLEPPKQFLDGIKVVRYGAKGYAGEAEAARGR